MPSKIIGKSQLTEMRVMGKRLVFSLLSAVLLTSCTEDSQYKNTIVCCGELGLVSNILNHPNDVIFFGSFETTKPGDPEWIRDWGIVYTVRADQIELSNNAVHGEKSIRISFPKGSYGAVNTGVQFPILFSKTGSAQKTFNSLYLSYYIYFEEDFDFRLGGKLPGLMGGGASWERTGGYLPSGSNGWSVRFMWRERGRAVVYAYLPPGKYRTSFSWGSDIELGKSFKTGVWHHVEQYVKINSIGKEDGKLHVWLDGEKLLDINDISYRTVENDNGAIGGILVSIFHGGNDPEWAPTISSHMRLDAIMASKKRVPTSWLNENKNMDSKL